MPSVLNSAVATGPGFDQMAGALRPVYSQEIRFNAMPVLRWPNFATRKEELTGQPGRQITMTKMNGIRRGGPLTEGKRVGVNSMSMTETSITVAERGNALGVTEFLLQTSFYDNMAAASMLLGRDLAETMNYMLRDAARVAPNKVYGGKKTSRGALTNGDTFDLSLCNTILESLASINAPKFGGEYYIVFVTPHQVSSLRQSPGWVMAQVYANTGRLFRGEVGMIADLKFIESTAVSNGQFSAYNAVTNQYDDLGFDPLLAVGAGSPANQTVIHQAMACGEYSYGLATSLLPELRDNGIKDFGREHALMWYAIDGQAIMANENILIVETA